MAETRLWYVYDEDGDSEHFDTLDEAEKYAAGLVAADTTDATADGEWVFEPCIEIHRVVKRWRLVKVADAQNEDEDDPHDLLVTYDASKDENHA